MKIEGAPGVSKHPVAEKIEEEETIKKIKEKEKTVQETDVNDREGDKGGNVNRYV